MKNFSLIIGIPSLNADLIIHPDPIEAVSLYEISVKFQKSLERLSEGIKLNSNQEQKERNKHCQRI